MNDGMPKTTPFHPDWSDALLSWYRANRRDLPWRTQPDPYRILVSEIMGQQTRMNVLVPYFERFVKRLPTIADLAQVDDDVLFKLWEGLGYHRRAANLKKAAILVMERYGGIIPATRDELLTLPGIGAYTAGAILSIAHNVFEPAIDGNVRRVIARQFGVEPDPASSEGALLVEVIVRGHAPADASADYTQALMEPSARSSACRTARRCATSVPVAGNVSLHATAGRPSCRSARPRRRVGSSR
ncbi:MAG: hypothetical protein MZW92_12390 [Comamonadaceae bacterium]|nr:hypothetical protein [Comamonadaceae bacterium]